MSAWSRWSSCTKSCGGGSQGRKRTVATIAKNGGKKCLGRKNEKRSCNKQKCICPQSTSNIVWVDGSKAHLGCVGFMKPATPQFGGHAEVACKQENSHAHLIEILNRDQQKFLLKTNRLNDKVKKIVGGKNSDWWIGAHLQKRKTWYWSHSKKKVSYIAKIGNKGSLDKSYSHAALHMSQTSAYWFDDNGHKGYVRPLCQISKAGDFSKPEKQSKKSSE